MLGRVAVEQARIALEGIKKGAAACGHIASGSGATSTALVEHGSAVWSEVAPGDSASCVGSANGSGDLEDDDFNGTDFRKMSSRQKLQVFRARLNLQAIMEGRDCAVIWSQ